MNQARDINTGHIIDAETLKFIYEEGLSNYQCMDDSCKVKLTPCSYKPHNKNRPYFKSVKGGIHTKTCRFSAYLKLIEKAKNRALTEIELEDMPFPTKLSKAKKTDKASATYKSSGSTNTDINTRSKRNKTSDDFVEKHNKSKVVTSLSPIVDFYIKCPFNRAIELDIEDKIQAYKYWFKRIEKPVLKGNYKGKKIFFGRLHTDKSKLEETDTTFNITMYECEKWVKGKLPRVKTKTQVNPFIISIDKTKLSKHKITRIKNELEYAIEEKIEAFKTKDSDSKQQAFVFFYGTAPKANNPYTFTVIDGALVARYNRILPTVDSNQGD